MNYKPTTHGATRAALIANGFFPCAASGQSGYQHVDEVGAVSLIPSHSGVDLSRVPNANARNLCAITVGATDPKARAAILKILTAHLGKSSPYKVDSAGNFTFIAALDFGDGPFSQRSASVGTDLDPAAAFNTSTKEDAWTFKSSVVTIGDPTSWVHGSPLTLKYSALPKLGDAAALWSEIQSELSNHAAPANYAPKWESEPRPQTVYGRQPLSPSELDAKIAARRKELAAQKAELAERTDQSIWVIVDASVRRVKNLGIGATPLDQAQAILRAESHESRIAHYDAIAQERAEAAELRAVRAKVGLSA